MKNLLIIASLLALTAPAHAASKAAIEKYRSAHDTCGGAQSLKDLEDYYPKDRAEYVWNACRLAAKLERRLVQQGYCIVGHTAAHEDRRLEKRCIVVR